MKPYYTDDTVTVWAGDCLDVLRTLPDRSADSVVTDPPAGIHFMSNTWDHDRGGRTEWVAWMTSVMAECCRILKPGGHAFVWALPRTSHWTAWAIEDAGLVVRDCVVHLFASGFPKSLDVSKAIDKQRHDRGDIRTVTGWISSARTAAGVTNRDVDEAFGFNGMAGHWTTQGAQAAIPTLDHIPRLLDVLGITAVDVPDEIRALLIDLNGMKGQPGPAWFQREVIGRRTDGAANGSVIGLGSARSMASEYDATAPATDDARAWEGWGTALKPGWEIVVCAQKPTPTRAKIGSRLDALEESCRQLANDAAKCSAPTPHASPEVRTDSAPEPVATQPEGEPARTMVTGKVGDSPAATVTSASESTAETCSSIVTSWKRCLVALSEPTSTSTTATTSETTTDLTTLWSCLSRLTEPSTLLDPTSPDGLSSLARAADSLFAAAVLSSNATRTLTATEPATSPTPPPSPAGGALSQIVVARKPLDGTVAANVVRHGTGALNIGACRIPGDEDGSRNRPPSRIGSETAYAQDEWTRTNDGGQRDTTGLGRWPANVILDESQAAALDAKSGEQRDGVSVNWNRNAEEKPGGYDGGWRKDTQDAGYGSGGGASRFYFTAKASSDERVRVDGVSHPTVKSLSLMRYLVRLVTPPGGTCLDPFAGSGTTVEAAILEGFRCVAIERETDYLPLITQRIHRRSDPAAYVEASGEDRGLFALLDEDTA